MKIRNLEERIKAAFDYVSGKERDRNLSLRRKEFRIARMLEILRRRVSNHK